MKISSTSKTCEKSGGTSSILIIEIEQFKNFNGDLDSIRRNAVKIGRDQSTKLKVDISRYEYCDQKEAFEIDGHTIYGYSPQVFVSEKLRAICQQMTVYAEVVRSNPSPRPRDFVDIHIISNHYGISWSSEDFISTVQKVFDQKRVPTDLIGKVQFTKEFHLAGFPSVVATVLPDYHLEEFDFYFEFVCHRCSELKSLWDK